MALLQADPKKQQLIDGFIQAYSSDPDKARDLHKQLSRKDPRFGRQGRFWHTLILESLYHNQIPV